MPKGPLGAPRPFSQYRVIIDPHEADVYLIKVGPLGGPRPFAKNNPPVDSDRVAECVISPSGRAFGAGVVSRGQTRDFRDLNPPQQAKAIELAEKWCEGVLEASAMEDLERGDSTAALESVKAEIGRQLQAGEQFDIEFID